MTIVRSRLNRSSRGARATAVALSALTAAVLLPSGAHADEAVLLGARTAWFWDSAEKVTTCTEDGVQNVCGDVSPSKGVFGNAGGSSVPITQGHLGIGVKDGASDMRAYVKFDTGDLPFGAQVESFIATFTVSEPDQPHTQQHGRATGAKAPGTFNEGQAVIQVCAVAAPWGASEGDPPSSTTVVRPRPEQPGGNREPQTTTTRAEPDVNCGLSAQARFSDDGKTLNADITEIAKAWGSGALFNEGIALHPVVQGVRSSWTVELHGNHNTVTSDQGTITFVTQAEAARARVRFAPPVAPPPPPPGAVDPGPQFPSFGDPIPSDPAPPSGGAFGDPPPAMPPAGNGGGQVLVGGAVGETPAWFFGAFPLGLLILGFVSGLIGPDPGSPRSVGVPSRVATVLRSRRLEDG